MHDNLIFNVNGTEDEDLLNALKLVFSTSGYKAESWIIDKKKGFVLLWSDNKGNKLPYPMSALEIFPMIKGFLESEQAKEIECKDWDEDTDHDGDNELGWRVYTENWGKIDGVDGCSFLAIKPTYVWYGK